MRRQGGGFGFVILLVVLAVVFFLAMRNFQSMAPATLEIQKHNKQRQAGDASRPATPEPKAHATSESADSWTPAPPSRPSLSTMDQKTSEHSSEVQSALSQAN